MGRSLGSPSPVSSKWNSFQVASEEEEELSGASDSIKSPSVMGDTSGGAIRSFIFTSGSAEADGKGVEWEKKAVERPTSKKTSAGFLTSGRQLLLDPEQKLKFSNHIAVTTLHPERPSRWRWSELGFGRVRSPERSTYDDDDERNITEDVSRGFSRCVSSPPVAMFLHKIRSQVKKFVFFAFSSRIQA